MKEGKVGMKHTLSVRTHLFIWNRAGKVPKWVFERCLEACTIAAICTATARMQASCQFGR